MSSIAMLLCGSSLACVQTTPMALSTSAFVSGDIDAWLRLVFCANETGRKSSETLTTQTRSWIFNFMCLTVPPNGFTFFHERLDSLVCVSGLHQFVQVNIFLRSQRGVECAAAAEIERVPRELKRRAGEFFQL